MFLILKLMDIFLVSTLAVVLQACNIAASVKFDKHIHFLCCYLNICVGLWH